MTTDQRKPQVLVLAALHQYHTDVACYGFEELRRIVSWYSPDALFGEVSEEDLRLRSPERVKREYPEVVYPLLEAAPSIRAHALEPSGDTRKRLIERMQAAARVFQEKPEYVQFEKHVREWLQALMQGWKTPADVNSGVTDDSVRAKHKRQRPLYPEDYTGAWEEWNEYFLRRILEVISRDRPAKALVLVGLEHCFWLRERLALHPGADMVDTQALLRARLENES